MIHFRCDSYFSMDEEKTVNQVTRDQALARLFPPPSYREICRTVIMDSVEILTKAVPYSDDTFDVIVEVVSDEEFQRAFEQKLYNVKNVDDRLDEVMKVHTKVLKHYRKKLSKKFRNKFLHKLYKAQNGICYLCGKHFPYTKMTKEHVDPRAKGGKNSQKNILLACSPCNGKKGDRLPTSEELAKKAQIHSRAKMLSF